MVLKEQKQKVSFSLWGINLQKFIIFTLRFLTSRAVLWLLLGLKTKLKGCLASISFLFSAIFNHFESVLHITGLWLPVPRKSIFWGHILKTCWRWDPINFHGTKNLLQMVSHYLWAWNWQIVFLGIWNLRLAGYVSIRHKASVKFVWFQMDFP